jgi:hypothetical protein
MGNEAFGEELKKRGAKTELRVMKVGETITVEQRNDAIGA